MSVRAKMGQRREHHSGYGHGRPVDQHTRKPQKRQRTREIPGPWSVAWMFVSRRRCPVVHSDGTLISRTTESQKG